MDRAFLQIRLTILRNGNTIRIMTTIGSKISAITLENINSDDFNVTLANVSDENVGLVYATVALAAAVFTFTFMAAAYLITKRRSKGSVVCMVSICALAAIAVVAMIANETSRTADAKAERSEVISKLVTETLEPSLKAENVSGVRLVPEGSSGRDIPELRLSAQTGEPQFMIASSNNNFVAMNLEAWAYDLSEGETPKVEVLYQDGKIETLEAGFTSDGEFALSSSNQ